MASRNSHKSIACVAAALMALSSWVMYCCEQSHALVITQEGCKWPINWPEELAEVNKFCRTIEVATGIQENIYEIRFPERAQFEQLWPAIVSIKTTLAPIRLKLIQV